MSEDKVISRWRSDRMKRESTLVRWGTYGQPVLLFPTAGGDAEEVERWHMIDVLRPLIDAGRIKVYACDSVAGMALVRREGSAQHQMWLQNQFHQYIRHEVVPAVRMDCKAPDLELWTAGASFGAFHAVAALCRFPDVFARAIGLSGTFDLRRFFDCPMNAFNDDFWVSSPLHFLPRLGGVHLDKLRQRFVLLPSGRGARGGHRRELGPGQSPWGAGRSEPGDLVGARVAARLGHLASHAPAVPRRVDPREVGKDPHGRDHARTQRGRDRSRRAGAP